MNILVISYENWCDTNNGGNVLSNIFDAFGDARFAQVYCSAGAPKNRICTEYFQITDTMLIKREQGRCFSTKDAEETSAPIEDESLKNHTKKSLLREFFMLGRELLWKFLPWKSPQLADFITGFKPDVIFAPCYAFAHVSRIALYAKQLTGCPIISYISDDNYSLRKISFSPSFWINKLITRSAVRDLFSECELIYTMTTAQKREYEEIFHKPMKILCKSADFDALTPNELHDPIRLIYGGGLYLNRWKLLLQIRKALELINRDGVKAQLMVFTDTSVNQRAIRKLHDARNAVVMPAIPYSRLMEEYRLSDIAVHVESFDKQSYLMTRLSFSTKIIDCLTSGCAVLAIGPRGQAGIDYLEENNAAVCIRDERSVASSVTELLSDPAEIRRYAERAIALGRRSHRKADISASIKNDFETIIKGQTHSSC